MKTVTMTYVRYVGVYQQFAALVTTVEVKVSSRETQDLNIPDGTQEFTFVDKTTVTLDDGRTYEQESNVSPPFKLKVKERMKG